MKISKINKRKMVRNKHNTPVIIKYPFWQMTAANPKAMYVCINYGEAVCHSRPIVTIRTVSKIQKGKSAIIKSSFTQSSISMAASQMEVNNLERY